MNKLPSKRYAKLLDILENRRIKFTSIFMHKSNVKSASVRNGFIAWLNTSLGMWILTGLSISIIGFLYGVYEKERELNLERLKILKEILYRVDIVSHGTHVKRLDEHEVMVELKNIEENQNQGEKYQKYLELFLSDEVQYNLFPEFSTTKTKALVSYYEINLRRSYFRWYIDRPNMKIESLSKDVAWGGDLILFNKETKYEELGAGMKVQYFFVYIDISSYFQYQYERSYFDYPTEEIYLDLVEKALGNIPLSKTYSTSPSDASSTTAQPR